MLRDVKAMYEPVGTEEVTTVLTQLLRRAWQVLDRDAPTARREIQRALELLSHAPVSAVVQPGHFRRARQGLAPWQVRRVIQHIQANLETLIRVDDMANLTRLSTSYFFRAFKRSFGMSPHAYVIVIRLERARDLLVQSDDQMTEIAAACGFADQAHFSRVFRRELGCAPGAWRREHRNLRNPAPAITMNIGVGYEV